VSLSASEVNDLKQAPAVDGVLPALLSRWSPRSFSEREIGAADLRRVFEAARWAASSSNEQPWRFIVGRRKSLTHQKIFETLVGFNKEWAGAAPVLILGVASAKFSRNGSPNGYALYDLGAAASYLTLQAAALGIRTHQMAGFDHDAARKTFDIPEDFLLGSVIAMGYQGEPAALQNDRLVAQETTPRSRKPLSEFVLSAWGEAADLS